MNILSSIVYSPLSIVNQVGSFAFFSFVRCNEAARQGEREKKHTEAHPQPSYTTQSLFLNATSDDFFLSVNVTLYAHNNQEIRH
jgi:hypothetical protein